MEVEFKKGNNKHLSVNFFNKFLSWLKSVFTNKFSLVYYFLLLLIISIGFYLIMFVNNNFTLAYGGDYTAQYIPMGYHVWDYFHNFFATGHFAEFDEAIYLGNSSIGGDAYYGLYSPFNILIVMFPRSFTPWAMAISSMIKLACAGLIFRTYIKSFGVKESIARLAGIAYAFCGWMAFYLWYNNYQDTLVFFPLVLLGIENVIKKKKPWLLIVGIFLLTISNYVLMISYIIAGFLYAMFRYFQKIKEHNAKDNLEILGIGFIAFLGGLLLAGAILFPAFIATINSPKVSSNGYWGIITQALKDGDIAKAFNYMFSWDKAMDQHGRVKPYRSMYPILDFFFPATTCRSMTTLELANWDFDDIAVSLWVYVPFILFLIPALIDSARKKKFSHLIGAFLLVISLFTPIMYFAFMGFTNCYARWTLFVVTSLLAYVSIYLDHFRESPKWYIHFGLLFAVLGITVSWIATNQLPKETSEIIHRFVYNDFDFTNIAFTVMLIYVVLIYLGIFFLYNKKHFTTLVTCAVCLEAVVMGNLVTYGHGYDTGYNNGYQQNTELKEIINNINRNDQNFYRMYTALNDGYSQENALMNNYSSGTYFHSLYNFNVNKFTIWSRMRYGDSAVGGVYRSKIQDLDNFLGVKYYIVDKTFQRTKADAIKDLYKLDPTYKYQYNVPLDFEECDYEGVENARFVTLVNKNSPDLGYTYPSISPYNTEDGKLDYIHSSDAYQIKNAQIYMTTALLSFSDYQEILEKYPSYPIDSVSNIYNHSTQYRMQIDGYGGGDHGYPYQVKFYKTNEWSKNYPLEKITNIPNDLPEISFNKMRENPMNYYGVIEKKDGSTFDYFNQGTSLYIKAPFSGSEKYNIYLIDEQNRIFTYDDHDDHSTDNNCYMRGFYSKDIKIKKIIYCGVYIDSCDPLVIDLETGKSHFDRINTLNEYEIKNVKYHNSDNYTFNTDFDSNRFVVTKIAYDKGWTLTRTDGTGKKEEVKTYLGMGGFVSFMVEPGNYSYSLTYRAEGSTLGRASTMFTFGVFTMSLFGYQLYEEKKRQKQYFLTR